MTFDSECLWILTKRFSPDQALDAWTTAVGAQNLGAKDFASWIFGCCFHRLSEMPSPAKAKERAPADNLSREIGKNALELTLRNSIQADSQRAAQLIEAMMDAAYLCGAPFAPAAKLFADKAAELQLPTPFQANNVGAPKAQQLLDALMAGHALWEAKMLMASLTPPAPSAKPVRARL